ncbi:hypothetical protein [Streptomyces sp. NPDC052496]|uniref:hypothetical protein n=1 Tax=Streptomyces sp. NPDC052496 TaxID=3154951 RepID=UPI003439C227
MKRNEPRPPDHRVFFAGTVAVAICVGTGVMASLSGWWSAVAGVGAAAVVALVGRLWLRQADLRYRTARVLAEGRDQEERPE